LIVLAPVLVSQQVKPHLIYEINFRAFSQEGNFKGADRGLERLQSLGVDCLYLMPIYPVGKLKSVGDLGSPYCVQDYTAVNPEFGSESDFKNLVDHAHKLGMKVLLDWVANHTSWDNPWIKAHPDWYQKDESGTIIWPRGTNYRDVAALDFRSEGLRTAMTEAMLNWVARFRVDGFRCDYAIGPPVEFWTQALGTLHKQARKPLFLVAEADRGDLLSAGFDCLYDWKTYGACQALFQQKISPKAFIRQATKDSNRQFRFVTNHDETAWNKPAPSLFGGDKAALGAFIVTAFTGGFPMLYTGEEIGWNSQIPIFGRSKVDFTSNHELLNAYQRVGKSIPNSEYGLNDFSTDQTVIFSRSSKVALTWVIVNPTKVKIQAALPQAFGVIFDEVSGTQLTLGSSITLDPNQSIVFRKKIQ